MNNSMINKITVNFTEDQARNIINALVEQDKALYDDTVPEENKLTGAYNLRIITKLNKSLAKAKTSAT